MPLPRILSQMLVGRAPDVLRPRRRHHERIVFQAHVQRAKRVIDPRFPWRAEAREADGAAHPSMGQFVTEDLDPPESGTTPLVLTPVNPAVGEALAEEVRQLSDDAVRRPRARSQG